VSYNRCVNQPQQGYCDVRDDCWQGYFEYLLVSFVHFLGKVTAFFRFFTIFATKYKTIGLMDMNNKKSAWAAIATIGVTAIAAGTTAIVKIRQKRKEHRRLAEQQREKEKEVASLKLTPEQMMVYNEGVRTFITLNNRIFELRHYQKETQPLIQMMATGKADDEDLLTGIEEIDLLSHDIRQFVKKQLPFVNTCVSIISSGDSYTDFVHGPIGGKFDQELDREEDGCAVADGTPIKHVLKLGYCFPESTIASYPVKSIVTV